MRCFWTRAFFSASLFLSISASAQAECFSADLGIVPLRTVYDNDQVSTRIEQAGKVITRRIKNPTSMEITIKAKYGIFPYEITNGADADIYRWKTELPDFLEIEKTGQIFRAEGFREEPGKAPVPIAFEIEILGRETVSFQGCDYETLDVRTVHFIDGKETQETRVLFEPNFWFSFRTETLGKDGADSKIVAPKSATATQ